MTQMVRIEVPIKSWREERLLQMKWIVRVLELGAIWSPGVATDKNERARSSVSVVKKRRGQTKKKNRQMFCVASRFAARIA